MFDNIKKLLGFGHFEVELLCSDKIDVTSKVIQGAIKIKSRQENVLLRLEMQLIEDFEKGRGDQKQKSEFVWALRNIDLDVYLPEGEFVIVPFRLDFEPVLSNMDKLGSSTLLSAPIQLAKFIKGVKSRIRLDIRCCIRGLEQSPIISKQLSI